MPLDPGFVRVVDLEPISDSLLGLVTKWQQQNFGGASADSTWPQLSCSYEDADGSSMDLAVPASDLAVGDVIDVEVAAVIGIRFLDDMMRPPAQQAVAQRLDRIDGGWRAEGTT